MSFSARLSDTHHDRRRISTVRTGTIIRGTPTPNAEDAQPNERTDRRTDNPPAVRSAPRKSSVRDALSSRRQCPPLGAQDQSGSRPQRVSLPLPRTVSYPPLPRLNDASALRRQGSGGEQNANSYTTYVPILAPYRATEMASISEEAAGTQRRSTPIALPRFVANEAAMRRHGLDSLSPSTVPALAATTHDVSPVSRLRLDPLFHERRLELSAADLNSQTSENLSSPSTTLPFAKEVPVNIAADDAKSPTLNNPPSQDKDPNVSESIPSPGHAQALPDPNPSSDAGTMLLGDFCGPRKRPTLNLSTGSVTEALSNLTSTQTAVPVADSISHPDPALNLPHPPKGVMRSMGTTSTSNPDAEPTIDLIKHARSASEQPTTRGIKRERSASPPLRTSAAVVRPVMEGSLRFAPVPEECRRPHPEWQRNRRAWIERECAALQGKGLKILKTFTRDDGMVIDWQSCMPVMSDTLLPAHPDSRPLPSRVQEVFEVDAPPAKRPRTSRQERSARPASENGTDIIDVDLSESTTVPVTAAPAPAAKPGALAPQGKPVPRDYAFATGRARLASPVVVDLPVQVEFRDADAGPVRAGLDAPRQPATTDTELPAPSASPEKLVRMPSMEERAELESAALAFLERYIETFDQDRSALASAYSRTATFSVLSPVPDAPGGQHIKQGCMEIVEGLLSLDGRWRFCSGGEAAKVDYDAVCLGEVGVLLVCYTGPRACGKAAGGRWACDQRFVLRRREWDEEDRSTDNLWPLVAVSHQMTVRLS